MKVDRDAALSEGMLLRNKLMLLGDVMRVACEEQQQWTAESNELVE